MVERCYICLEAMLLLTPMTEHIMPVYFDIIGNMPLKVNMSITKTRSRNTAVPTVECTHLHFIQFRLDVRRKGCVAEERVKRLHPQNICSCWRGEMEGWGSEGKYTAERGKTGVESAYCMCAIVNWTTCISIYAIAYNSLSISLRHNVKRSIVRQSSHLSLSGKHVEEVEEGKRREEEERTHWWQVSLP